MSDRKSEVTLVWTLDRMWWAEELEIREQKTAMEWETRSAGASSVQKSEIKTASMLAEKWGKMSGWTSVGLPDENSGKRWDSKLVDRWVEMME